MSAQVTLLATPTSPKILDMILNATYNLDRNVKDYKEVESIDYNINLMTTGLKQVCL